MIMEKYHKGTIIGIDEEGNDCSKMPLLSETDDGITSYGVLVELTMSPDGKLLQIIYSDDGYIEIFERMPEGFYRKHLPNVVGEMPECPRCKSKDNFRIKKCSACGEFACTNPDCASFGDCPTCGDNFWDCELYDIVAK